MATNTVAQGDTRQVGLDQICEDGFSIFAAIKSRKWPTQGANLEFSVVWASRRPPVIGVRSVSEGAKVPLITPSLDPASRSVGRPERLVANSGIAFAGFKIDGIGFTLSDEEAQSLLAQDARNADVLFPFANGADLNSRPDSSASRWVINFFDWSEDRARTYADCYEIVRQKVKPARDRNNRELYRRNWWLYAEARPGLLKAIAKLQHVLVITVVSKVVLPVRVPTGVIYSHATIVFATDDYADLALLSSSPHYWWAISNSSTMRTDLRYASSDVFETLPRPRVTARMRKAGAKLDEERRMFMLGRQLGLTKTYNLVHDPDVLDTEVARLRALHVEIDEAVCTAYGWDDLALDHGHYDTRQGVRWTVSPIAQIEMLDRLLELNHAQYAKEQEGLLGGKHGKVRSAVSGRTQYSADTLFDSGNTLFDPREDS